MNTKIKLAEKYKNLLQQYNFLLEAQIKEEFKIDELKEYIKHLKRENDDLYQVLSRINELSY